MSEVNGYTREVLFDSPLFEVVSCQWAQGVVSPTHNHGQSQCYTLIKNGVFENTTYFASKLETTILESGQSLSIPPYTNHGMKCLSKMGESIHVYTP